MENVLIGAILGGLFTYLAQNYARILAEDVATINDHIQEISKIEETATAYWLSAPERGSEEDNVLRSKLHGGLSVSACFRRDAKKLLGNRFQSYVEMDGKLFDSATGGSFETADRKPEVDRAIQIANHCHEIRYILRAARRARYWFN